MNKKPTFCPFAARCRWRLDVCWQENPPLRPTIEGTRVVMTVTEATHQIACFNPPTPEEAAAGKPLSPSLLIVSTPANS